MIEEMKRCDCGAAGLMRVSVRGFQCMCVNSATCGARTAWFDSDDDAERAWNRRAPSVTREEIARLLCSRHAGGCVCASEERSSTCPSRLDDADAILALLRGE